jgi:hypothetical protein
VHEEVLGAVVVAGNEAGRFAREDGETTVGRIADGMAT